jgi:pimeloyl-ACP methyl ester carboxylesterase
VPDDMDRQVAPVDLLIPVSPADGGQEDWHIAVSVYLPADEALAGRPAAIVVLPGGGYGRRYFDLPGPGCSQAAYHTRRGMVVIAVDHLGVGDSTVPAAEFTTLPGVAAAGHAAVSAVIARLAAGTLAPGVPPVRLACVVGAGQSLGGHALAVMQAAHRTFDGVAMLGSSMAGTALPVRPGTPPPVVPDGTTPEQAAQVTRAATDWTWAFHWQDAPLPDELAALIAADIAGGVPARRTAPPWGSLTYPGFGALSMLPGVVAAEAARIDVPVLLAVGERDVCRSPGEEVAVFKAATDISFFRMPRMAHMHNFSATRILLWDRLDEFAAHVARVSASGQAGFLPAMPGEILRRTFRWVGGSWDARHYAR